MNKKETAVLEQILNNCKNLPDDTRDRVLWITEGMALVGGRNNDKNTKR